ncbi:MAG TPA: RES family NAD+ phosphorylase [Albitalea sp.]|nr:RES family NAD+ phosphorylase [Albitalea sp.]
MTAWREAWFASGIRIATAALWRGVEAQHRVATMRLVDTLDEQAELERILEASKPPLPAEAAHLHPLLATPFRYRSPHPSRFRRAGEPGLWYGAQELHTACAEVGYWRWRFLMDSAGLRDGELVTEHSFFQAQVRGAAIDLTRAPWKAASTAWTDPDDYSACQALGQAARSHAVQWIRYASVRQPEGICGAVLAPACLSLNAATQQQTWVSKVTAQQALMLHDGDRLTVAIAR